MATITRIRRKDHAPNSFPHYCPQCEIIFYGRKNQTYCSKEHKIKFNNAKAADMNIRVSEQVRMLKKNAQILEEIYSTQTIPFLADYELLNKKGFIMNSPSVRLKTDNGEEWQMIGQYVLKPEKDGQRILIMTKNDLKKI